jgi:aminoglycoside phosphotransferase (APT) family kinase protein
LQGQYDQMRVAGIDQGAIVGEVGEALAARIPDQQRVSIVHGDYRLDNTVLNVAGGVRAILDWEICTLGDPLADLGMLCDYWADPGDTQVALMGASPTTAPGFESRDQVAKAYEQASGLDCSSLPYYRAFGYWKLACILQGVYARYAAGATAGDAGPVDSFPAHVVTLAESARDLLATLP